MVSGSFKSGDVNLITFRLKMHAELDMSALRLRHTTKETSLVHLLWRVPQVLFLYKKDLDINAMVFCFRWDGSPTALSGVLKSSPALLAKSSTVTRLSPMASCATQKMRMVRHDSLVWRNEGARGRWGSTSMYINGMPSLSCTANILYLLFAYSRRCRTEIYGVLLFSKNTTADFDGFSAWSIGTFNR